MRKRKMGWFGNLFKTKEQIRDERNAEYAEEDKKRNYIYGRRVDDIRKYDNGCYGIIIPGKDKWGYDDNKIELHTKNGVKIGEYKETDVCNWHHGFIQINCGSRLPDVYVDCDGNKIICHGVFLEDDEMTDKYGFNNLYLVPVGPEMNKYIVYNHKTHTITNDEHDEPLRFDGIRCRGNMLDCVIRGNSETSGWGDLADTKYYDTYYTLDLEGNIFEVKESERREKE
jgi:hypothetical protein